MMRNAARALAAPVLALAAVLASGPARAVEPEMREVVVLHNRVFDGFGYQENFVPSAVDTFHLLADHDSAIGFVQTMEYWWPLSRQYYVGLDTLAEVPQGRLKVTRGEEVVLEAAMEPYAVFYPDGANRPGARLAWGAAALAADAEHRAAMAAYNRALASARSDRVRYDGELKKAAIARLAGEPVAEVAPPAPEPDPVRSSVSAIRAGYRVSLPAGRYQVGLYDGDGRLIEGSRRNLVVFAPPATTAVTMDVIPEERWTRILASNTAADEIHAAPGSTLYLALNFADRFDDRDWTRLVDPQGFGTAGRDNWVRRSPATDRAVEVSRDGRSWDRLALGAYKVRQTRGTDLGYAIEPAAPGETPDLSAFAVTIPADADRLHLRIVEAASGRPVPGGEREVSVANQRDPRLVWGAALVPLMIGVGLGAERLGRRMASRRPGR